MSALPTRKKTPEELAKLREEAGMLPPGVAPAAMGHRPPAEAPAPAEPEAPRPPPEAKKVRSLKRSERVPVPAKPVSAVPNSELPVHRRSERQLEEMRRAEAMRALSYGLPPAVSHLKHISAHPALLILGYVLAIAGGLGAFPVALYIAMKKPRSRHHAGFMAMIGLLVVVFGAIYKFPQLNPIHAS